MVALMYFCRRYLQIECGVWDNGLRIVLFDPNVDNATISLIPNNHMPYHNENEKTISNSNEPNNIKNKFQLFVCSQSFFGIPQTAIQWNQMRCSIVCANNNIRQRIFFIWINDGQALNTICSPSLTAYVCVCVDAGTFIVHESLNQQIRIYYSFIIIG